MKRDDRNTLAVALFAAALMSLYLLWPECKDIQYYGKPVRYCVSPLEHELASRPVGSRIPRDGRPFAPYDAMVPAMFGLAALVAVKR